MLLTVRVQVQLIRIQWEWSNKRLVTVIAAQRQRRQSSKVFPFPGGWLICIIPASLFRFSCREAANIFNFVILLLIIFTARLNGKNSLRIYIYITRACLQQQRPTQGKCVWIKYWISNSILRRKIKYFETVIIYIQSCRIWNYKVERKLTHLIFF